MRELQVNKRDPMLARIVDVEPPPLPDGAARLKVEFIALTSNNMTYAVMGEGFAGYWDFFPGPQGWGKPPAWGFARVVASRAEGVPEGARYFGFFPICETLDVIPTQVGARGFVDGAAHRAGKAAVYNHYADTRADPAFDAAFELEQALVRPLYSSGWWVADRVQQDHPATVVISSASSKTALFAAHQLRRRGGALLVALTSARHRDFVAETGLYDRIHAYDDLSGLSATAPATYVDFLGREQLGAAVQQRLGAALERIILVGATDWVATPGGLQQPSPAPSAPPSELLFIPDYAARRLKTDRGLGAAMLGNLRHAYADSREFFTVRREAGAIAITDAWARLAAGKAVPQEGLVLSF